MTALDFPSSPTYGQTYDAYTWDGEKWYLTVGGTGAAMPFDLTGLGATGAWSPSRKLLSAYGGAYYTPTGSPTRAGTLLDQSGNSRDFSGSGGSGALIGGSSPIPLVCNGATSGDTIMQHGTTNLITTTSAYMILSMQVAAWTTNTVYYGNAALLQTNGQNYGLTVGGTGSSGTIYATTYSPSVSVGSIALNTPYVVEFRVESGTLYLRVNGTGEVSTGASSSQGMDALNLGGRFTSNCFDGYIWEAATFTTVPSLANRDAMVQYFGDYVGASV